MVKRVGEQPSSAGDLTPERPGVVAVLNIMGDGKQMRSCGTICFLGSPPHVIRDAGGLGVGGRLMHS